MSALAGFFAMGGYALYVWPAMAIVAVVLIGLLLESLRQLTAAEVELSALEARAPGARRARTSGNA